ncbi:sel1 repeat family protein [Halomonas sp. ML-15]|uniref:tetratricopeptide repeat protein n=1 Tax=Halomonas sp. ML-15 TaxID=2773305 RepID=UPI001746C87A|nr:tetratricopeptide repeat protein [Halomonas sp. ML-15]MBD3895305.1 sel1 repeat family protein [Halomonas sp. ML-15]
MGRIGVLALVVLLLSPISGWALDAETQAAKEEGLRLYNAHLRSQASPYLEPAAEAGDAEAMYYLGEIHRLRHMGMTREALEWYQRAAEKGEPYAMLRLHQGGACQLGDVCPESGDDWREAALETTLPLAEAGDTEAMYTLFLIYSTLEETEQSYHWLETAAETGNPEAEYRLGARIQNDYGDYPDNTARLQEAEAWLRRAAEQGHAPAMSRLSATLSQQERHEESWEWMIQASEKGLLDARLGMGWCYLEPDRDQKCLVEQDVVTGWAILFAMVEETNNVSAEWLLQTRGELLTAEQHQEAEALSEEWLDKEPPLSEFPPRFGY